MTESVQNNVNRPQLTFMDAVDRGAKILMQMGAVYNNNYGCFGYGYLGGGFRYDPYYGMDAIDMMIRNGNFGCPAGGVNYNNGQNTPAAVNEKLQNPAEAFKNMPWEKIEEMKEREKAIKAKEKEVSESKDDETKNRLAKELQDLKNDYLKAERELANGIQLSKELGNNTTFTFYTNINEKEFEQIGEFNTAIDALKSEIAKIEEESNNLKIEFEKARTELMRQGKPCDDQSVLASLPADKRTRIENNKKIYDEKVAETEAKISQLKSCVAKAGKDGNTTYFYTHIAKTAKEKQENATTEAGQKLAEEMFGSDGKIKSREELKTKIKDNNPSIDDDYIDSFLDSFYKEGMTAEELKAKLQSDDFFKTALKNITLENDAQTTQNRAKFLIGFYERVMGEGSFRELSNNNTTANAIVQKADTPVSSEKSQSQTSSSAQHDNNSEPTTNIKDELEELEILKELKDYKLSIGFGVEVLPDNITTENIKNGTIKIEELSNAVLLYAIDKGKIDLENLDESQKEQITTKLRLNKINNHRTTIENIRNGEIKIEELSDAVLLYAIQSREIIFENLSKEQKGQITIRLNTIADKYEYEGHLYRNEDMWQNIRFYKDCEIPRDNHIIRFGDYSDYEDLGEEFNNKEEYDALKTFTNSLIAHIKK